MSIRRLILVTVSLLCGAGAAGGAGGQEVRREYAELHLGVAVRLVLYAADDAAARAAARAAYDTIAQLEHIMSDYRPQSEVRRLAENPGTPVQLSEHLYAVLARALDLSRRSHGAFDPTVGPFVALWRGARSEGRLPSRAGLDSAAQLVGWRKIHLDTVARTARLDVAGMKLDLGGIAKGYIIDQALAELRRQGVRRAMIQAGGDIVAGDAPPGRDGWRVDIPESGPALGLRARAVANAALAISGDTEQFVVVDGVRYSHVVDPRTGMGLTTRRRAVVIAPDGATADGLATALVVLDDSAGAALLREYPGAVAEVRVMRD